MVETQDRTLATEYLRYLVAREAAGLQAVPVKTPGVTWRRRHQLRRGYRRGWSRWASLALTSRSPQGLGIPEGFTSRTILGDRTHGGCSSKCA